MRLGGRGKNLALWRMRHPAPGGICCCSGQDGGAGGARFGERQGGICGDRLPGIIDAGRGIVRYSNNFGWQDAALAEDIRRRLGLSVRMANDAQCAALGEALYGAGRGVARMAMLTIGTGVGGGFVRDGRLETDGYGSMAYIFGHAVIAHQGRECNCGRRGCLEAYASATAIGVRGRRLWEEEKA